MDELDKARELDRLEREASYSRDNLADFISNHFAGMVTRSAFHARLRDQQLLAEDLFEAIRQTITIEA